VAEKTTGGVIGLPFIGCCLLFLVLGR